MVEPLDYSRLIMALEMIKGVGPKTARQILARIPAARLAQAGWIPGCRVAAVRKQYLAGNLDPHKWLDIQQDAADLLAKTVKDGAQVINYQEEAYPQNMRRLVNFPLLLYVKGDAAVLNTPSVGFIGTRRPTDLGAKMSRRMAQKFATDGYTVVSGLSIGTNTAAHRGALDVPDGKTVAILGESLEQPIYPPENEPLADEIIARGGALVSSFRYGTAARRQFLAARDEWESGISDGLVVVETDQNGKTEMALQHAFKQHRPVAMLDHSQCPQIDDVTKIPEALGNQEFIKADRAMPLWQEDSLEVFERRMASARRRRLAERPATPQSRQMHLF